MGSHIWSLFAPIHIKSWTKVKLGQIQVGLNIAEIRSSYYLLQFCFIYTYLASKYYCCLYLALLTYIYHYLPIFGCI